MKKGVDTEKRNDSEKMEMRTDGYALNEERIERKGRNDIIM